MDYKINSVSAYKAMLDDILESYRASGLTHRDLMVWRPRAEQRRVNLTGLMEDLLREDKIHLICPVCEGYLEAQRSDNPEIYRERSWFDKLRPSRTKALLRCTLCRFTVRSRKPVIDALADVAAEMDDCRQNGGVLEWTRRQLDRQYDDWSELIEKEPPLLKRTIYQPFVPFPGKQLENRRSAMEHVKRRLEEPESLGFDYSDIQLALSGFPGRNASRFDNLFSYLEHRGITDAYGTLNEPLLRQVVGQIRGIGPL